MCIGAGDICFKGKRRFPKARSPNLAQSGFAKTEDVACSKRSDSGERCEVEKAMKSRGGLGREVREPSPLLLSRFYFFALLFTSHRSPLSERLDKLQGMKLKIVSFGERAASPTFSRETIRTCLNRLQIDSKMLLTQKPKKSLQRTINRPEKRDNA